MNKVISINAKRSADLRKHRKESSFYKQLSLIDLNNGRELAIIRFYGAGSVCYCCAWLKGFLGIEYSRGSGKAGGGGYHKESAAMQEALNVAGFTFAEPFDGCGDNAMVEALEAIARRMGLRSRFVIVRAGA